MPLPALQLLERKFEQQRRLFELKKGAWEREIGRHIEIFEQKKGALERKIELQFETHRKKIEQKLESQKKKIETQFRRLGRLEQNKGIRLDDEFRFIRSWIEKPLAIGAVTPSGRALARTMAAYVDPTVPGPIVELGPGTGPVTQALVAQGIDPARLVLVEFNPAFCRLLRQRYPTAMVVQGDAYGLKRLLAGLLRRPAAAVVSGLPLFTKPPQTRLRLLYEAFGLMLPGAPFVQFTYHAVPPIPKALDRVRSEASERVWMNIPPARVWVYRRD
jgi:phosphatidylethanolamine/phosphatidyl-N-methylethanolamine N-methyltransferase